MVLSLTRLLLLGSVLSLLFTLACSGPAPTPTPPPATPTAVSPTAAPPTPTSTPIPTSTTTPTTSPTPTPTPRPTLTPLPSAERLIKQAGERFGQIRSAAFQLQLTEGKIDLGSGFLVDNLTGQIARPDRVRLKTTATVSGNVVEFELIKIGSQLYLLNPFSRQWQPLPPGSSTLESLNPFAAAEVFSQATNLTRVGRSSINGVDAWQIRGTLSPDAVIPLIGARLGELPIIAEMWTGVQDDLPRQIRLEIPLLSGTRQIVTITLSELDRPVTIEPPT